jgi:hypothetical protein
MADQTKQTESTETHARCAQNVDANSPGQFFRVKVFLRDERQMQLVFPAREALRKQRGDLFRASAT